MESGFEAAAWAGGSYAAGSEMIYDLSWFWPAACEDIFVGYLLKRCGGWGKEKSERGVKRTRAGSPSCRKGITLFAPIVPLSAKTLNQ